MMERTYGLALAVAVSVVIGTVVGWYMGKHSAIVNEYAAVVIRCDDPGMGITLSGMDVYQDIVDDKLVAGVRWCECPDGLGANVEVPQ